MKGRDIFKGQVENLWWRRTNSPSYQRWWIQNDKEMVKLRAENRALRKELALRRPQTPSSIPRPIVSSGRVDLMIQAWPGCVTCGKEHKGRCLRAQNICYKCRRPGHFARTCLLIVALHAAPPASTPTVQMEKIEGRGPIGGGRAHKPASIQGADQLRMQTPMGRG